MPLPDVYRLLVRPLLFSRGADSAETVHTATLAALERVGRYPAALAALREAAGVERLTRRLPSVHAFGIDFPHAVGLAAGMDKDAQALPAWQALGLAFVEVGTVTRHAQPGNPRPRLFRLPDSGAVINRMGFNNHGAAAMAGRLRAVRPKLRIPIGVSIGKTKATPLEDATDDYLGSLREVAPYADYLAVNVSSPNTPGLRRLQDADELRGLLHALLAELPAATGGRRVPLLVKISPDLTDAALDELLEVCTDTGVAGLVAVNTTLGRDGLTSADVVRYGDEAGGLSGGPLTARAREVVRYVVDHCGDRLPVIGVGGLGTADDASRMLDAGAVLLQLYTGFIYVGPGLVRAIADQVRWRPVGSDTVGAHT